MTFDKSSFLTDTLFQLFVYPPRRGLPIARLFTRAAASNWYADKLERGNYYDRFQKCCCP